MKIQIDTREKSIAVLGDVKMSEFVKALKRLLPDDEWKDFVLKEFVEVKWHSPLVIKEIHKFTPYVGPYWYTTGNDIGGTVDAPTITVGDTFSNESSYTSSDVQALEYVLRGGLYCIDIE